MIYRLNLQFDRHFMDRGKTNFQAPANRTNNSNIDELRHPLDVENIDTFFKSVLRTTLYEILFLAL